MNLIGASLLLDVGSHQNKTDVLVIAYRNEISSDILYIYLGVNTCGKYVNPLSPTSYWLNGKIIVTLKKIIDVIFTPPTKERIIFKNPKYLLFLDNPQINQLINHQNERRLK